MCSRALVGIVGLGMVGTPIRRWFEERCGYHRGRDLFCYDTDPKLGCFDDVAKAEVTFVCVPTPPNTDGSCNTSIVQSVVGGMPPNRIVVIKSTVPPGTTQTLQNGRKDLGLMFCPEFLTESQAWEDFLGPSRQIIGVTAQSLSSAVDVLRLLPRAPFSRPYTPVFGGRKLVTATEAEMAKYASNVFGAVKVVFANILADISWAFSRAYGTDVSYEHVADMLGADSRIGDGWLDVDYGNYCGFGGYCFPKDTAAFISFYGKLIGQLSEKTEARPYLATMRAGLNVLQAAYAYNTTLLAAQNLTVSEVSMHNEQLILEKRRSIRTA